MGVNEIIIIFGPGIHIIVYIFNEDCQSKKNKKTSCDVIYRTNIRGKHS